jgi:hypothetical protein
MKKLIAVMFVLTLMLSSVVFAQSASVSQGNMEFGIGNLFSYTRIWDDDSTINIYNVGTFGNGTSFPAMGILYPTPTLNFDYFLIDNLAIGVLGGYQNMKNEDVDDPIEAWFVGPELKYYIGVTDSVLVDVHGSFVYTAMKSGGSDIEQNHIGVGAALNFFFNKYLALSLGLDYAKYFEMKEDGEKVDDSDFNNLKVALGLKAFVSFSE